METQTFFTHLVSLPKNLRNNFTFAVSQSVWALCEKYFEAINFTPASIYALKSVMPPINLTAFEAYKTIQTFITSINMLAIFAISPHNSSHSSRSSRAPTANDLSHYFTWNSAVNLGYACLCPSTLNRLSGLDIVLRTIEKLINLLSDFAIFIIFNFVWFLKTLHARIAFSSMNELIMVSSVVYRTWCFLKILAKQICINFAEEENSMSFSPT